MSQALFRSQICIPSPQYLNRADGQNQKFSKRQEASEHTSPKVLQETSAFFLFNRQETEESSCGNKISSSSGPSITTITTITRSSNGIKPQHHFKLIFSRSPSAEHPEAAGTRH
jgi:hypothetical protein